MGNVNVNEKLPFSEALSYGGQMFLIGMVVVFAVLAVIYLCLLLFKTAFANTAKKKPVVEKKVEAAKVDDGELIAVIAAAIAMAENDHSGMKFRVVSFKRV